jgi:hypothetical protein
VKTTDAIERARTDRLERLTTPRLTRYIAHRPAVPQATFLLLNCYEAMYGGAAAGGKSDALLMAALQYVDVPGYSAILFRRSYPDLALPEAIMSRSKEWLKQTDAHWNEQSKRWTFPSGATLSFGYLDIEDDKYRYASAEFQFIGFDEEEELRDLRSWRSSLHAPFLPGGPKDFLANGAAPDTCYVHHPKPFDQTRVGRPRAAIAYAANRLGHGANHLWGALLSTTSGLNRTEIEMLFSELKSSRRPGCHCDFNVATALARRQERCLVIQSGEKWVMALH